MLGNGLPGGTESVSVNHRTAFGAQLARFRREEDGSLLIFGLFCFVCMLFLAGVALDLMRFEERRTVLQNTIDRAILAAADLDQTKPCEDVIKDYFLKAGLDAPADSEIICQKGTFDEWRVASACTQEQMPTWFMKAWGISTLKTPACGTAEERVGNVEVSLVLDVSGSMDSNNRLINLKPAAKAFIDQMFDTVEAGRLSINLITYSTQTALGPDLYKYFYTSNEHTRSTCLDFDVADFNTAAVSPKSTPVGTPAGLTDKRYNMTGYFEPFNTTMNTKTTFDEPTWLTECPSDTKEPWRKTLAFSGDRAALKAQIDLLQAAGNTSIDIGMKWGAALMDPEMQPVVDRMITEGKVNGAFGERPYSYANTEALKVIVIMTDGSNTTEYRLKTNYNGDPNPLQIGDTLDPVTKRMWKNNSTTYASITDLRKYTWEDSTRTTNKYFSMATGTWRSTPWGSNATDIAGTDSTSPMTWPEIWNEMSVNYFADNIICKAYGTNSSGSYSSSACQTERNKWRTSATDPVTVTKIASTKDSRTLAICNAAKAQKVKIFTIGFEAPTAGLTLLKSCATSPAHFYSVQGLNIQTAFKSIAQSINKLRLTH